MCTTYIQCVYVHTCTYVYVYVRKGTVSIPHIDGGERLFLLWFGNFLLCFLLQLLQATQLVLDPEGQPTLHA